MNEAVEHGFLIQSLLSGNWAVEHTHSALMIGGWPICDATSMIRQVEQTFQGTKKTTFRNILRYSS